MKRIHAAALLALSAALAASPAFAQRFAVPAARTAVLERRCRQRRWQRGDVWDVRRRLAYQGVELRSRNDDACARRWS